MALAESRLLDPGTLVGLFVLVSALLTLVVFGAAEVLLA